MARRGSKKSGWRLRKRNNKNKTRRGGEDGLPAASSSDPMEVSDVLMESSGDPMEVSDAPMESSVDPMEVSDAPMESSDDFIAPPAEAEVDQIAPPAEAELEEAIDDMQNVSMDLDEEDYGVGPEIGDVEQEKTGGNRRRITQKRRQTKRLKRNKKGRKTRRVKRTKSRRSRSRK